MQAPVTAAAPAKQPIAAKATPKVTPAAAPAKPQSAAPPPATVQVPATTTPQPAAKPATQPVTPKVCSQTLITIDCSRIVQTDARKRLSQDQAATASAKRAKPETTQPPAGTQVMCLFAFRF